MARADGPKGPAEEVVDQLLNQGFLDELMDRVDEGGVQLTGEGGFLPELVKRVLEAGLHAELTGHLGYEKHDPWGTVREILATGRPRNGLAPRSAILIWSPRGTVTAPSTRGWCRRGSAESAACRR